MVAEITGVMSRREELWLNQTEENLTKETAFEKSSVVKLLDKEKVVELARSYAGKGFLCSESVLLAISDWLEVQSDLIPRIAAGFGALPGTKSSTCRAKSEGGCICARAT